MTDTHTAPPRQRSAKSAKQPAAQAAPQSRTNALIAVVAAILVVALFLFLILQQPRETKPTSIGFSLNSFFRWLGNQNQLVQIPIVLVVFGAVVGILLLLIEYAPRPGKLYFWIRLVACFALPVLAFMLLRPYQNALLYVLGIAVVLGGAMFLLDYRSREGAGYHFQLVLFAAPAAILLLVGLVYPAIATFVQSFFDKTGKDFVGMDNYVWVFTQRKAPGRSSTPSSGCSSPPPSRRSSGSRTPCSSTGRRGRSS